MASIQTEVAGLLAFTALLLLPGILAVRAPWTSVPFLSASFWILSAWWVDLVGVSRVRFLVASLTCFTLLAMLRLLRAERPKAPGWPTLLVLVFALVRLAPYPAWPVAPGADMSLHSVSTLLLVWRDGIPNTYEPLLPIPVFGAYTPALHGLAADVSLLSGLPAHRSAFLVSAAAHGLLQVSLFALLGAFFEPRVAGLAALATLGLARAPQSFFGWGGNPTVLALAFLTQAAALLARGRSRSAAAAAGWLLAATLVAHAMMALVALALLPLVLYLRRSASQADRPQLGGGLVLAGAMALAASAPFLLRLDYTLSPGERAWLADHLRTHYAADWARFSDSYPLAVIRYVIATLNDAFLWAALAGAAIAMRRRSPALPAAALCVALLVSLAGTARAGGLGPLVVFPERPLALAAIVLSSSLAILLDALLSRRGRVPALILLALLGTAIERMHRYYFSAASTVMVSRDDLEAMAWIRDHTNPLDLVCNEYGTPGMWVGALAGRAISAPQLPPFYFDEFRRGLEGRRCDYRYVSERWFFGTRRSEPGPLAGRPAFRNASVVLLTSFDTGDRNLAKREP